MTLKQFRNRIKSCRMNCCEIEPNPLYFECDDCNSVKCLIITEQPKLDIVNYNKYKEQSIYLEQEELLKRIINGVSAYKKPVKTPEMLVYWFSEKLKESINMRTGPYYWTHLVKCEAVINNKKTNRRSDDWGLCADIWLEEEIQQFPNLKCIITFGAKAFYTVREKLSIEYIDYYDYIWELLTLYILNKPISEMQRFSKNALDFLILGLPHPSFNNNVSKLMPKFMPGLVRIIEAYLAI